MNTGEKQKMPVEKKLIRLEITKDMPSYMELAIIDNGDRKRGTITMDYSMYDIKPLLKEGRDIEGAIGYYTDWLYSTLKRYLLAECEIEGGIGDILEKLRGHIDKYFE